MTLARSLPTAANSCNDTASTRVLGEAAAWKDAEPLVRSLTACHLSADTHSNDHAQTLLDEVCECCLSAYYSRTNKTTRPLFSRDPAYRKPIRRRAVLNHDCYSFSDERHEMKRSDPALLHADATLRKFSTSFCRDQTRCTSGDLLASKYHPHQPARRSSSFSTRLQTSDRRAGRQDEAPSSVAVCRSCLRAPR